MTDSPTVDLSPYDGWAPDAMRRLARALDEQAWAVETPGHIQGRRHDWDCWCNLLDEDALTAEELRHLSAVAALQGIEAARAETLRLARLAKTRRQAAEQEEA